MTQLKDYDGKRLTSTNNMCEQLPWDDIEAADPLA